MKTINRLWNNRCVINWTLNQYLLIFIIYISTVLYSQRLLAHIWNSNLRLHHPQTWKLQVCKSHVRWLISNTSSYIQEQHISFTSAYSEKTYVIHDTQHFRCLDVCCLHSEFLGNSAPDWPWQWVRLVSFPCSLPFLQPYVMGVIFGMLLMSELEGIPSCWMLSPISLKIQHQKRNTWKWLTQLSPEFRHFN